MASITFRLKCSRHVGTIDMEGPVMQCRDVQKAVAAKLSASPDEVRVFMAGSTDLLHPEEDIPAYAVVDIVRHVFSGKPSTFKSRTTASDATAMASAAVNSSIARVVGNAHEAVQQAPLTEEERLAELQAEVTLDTGIAEVGGWSRRGGGRGSGRGMGSESDGGGGGGRGAGRVGGLSAAPTGAAGFNRREDFFRPPPKSYICHNCGKRGHFIQHCPAAKDGRYTRVLSLPVGIPESMLVECGMDDPAPKFITRDHRLVKRRMDASALAEVMLPPCFEHSETAPPGTPGEHSKEITRGEFMETINEGGAHKTPATCDTSSRDNASAALMEEGNFAKAGVGKEFEAYRCIVDGVVAVDAMRTPCCSRLMCKSCFDRLVEEAFGKDDGGDDDGPVCRHCGEVLILDDVVDAVKERVAIEHLQNASRKRPRS